MTLFPQLQGFLQTTQELNQKLQVQLNDIKSEYQVPRECEATFGNEKLRLDRGPILFGFLRFLALWVSFTGNGGNRQRK